MTAQRDVVRIAALEVRVSALASVVEELRDELAKMKAERAIRQQGKAA